MIVVNFHKSFGDHPFIHTCARGKNTLVHILSYVPYVCVRAPIFTKIFVGVHYSHMSVSLKFHKNPSFCLSYICKALLTIKNHQFSMYFAHIHSFSPPKAWNLLETRYQIVPIKRKKCHISNLIGHFLA